MLANFLHLNQASLKYSILFILLIGSLKNSLAASVGTAEYSNKAPEIGKDTNLNSDSSLKANQAASPFENNDDHDLGFIEVNESDLPEGALVYVVDEPEEENIDGETLKTANNIVFRPLFRYQQKNSLNRRVGLRRKYYIPRRTFRHTYYPYYYNRRYYY